MTLALIKAEPDRLAAATEGLAPDSAGTLRQRFETMFADADKWVARSRSIVVTSEDQEGDMKLARTVRLELKAIRVNAEKARKALKEDSVRYGKAIDGIANVLKALIEPEEEYLLEQETFAERAAEKRRGELRDARASVLRALGADPSTYADLGLMEEEAWLSVEGAARLADEQRKEQARQAEAVRVEAERLAAAKREEERQAAIKAEAERVERERVICEENARLKAEADAREAERVAERERLAAEQRKRDADAMAERIRADAEARKVREEADRVTAENARLKADAERKERERVEAEERKAAEEKRRAEVAAMAPDAEKLLTFAQTLRMVQVPTLTTVRGKQIVIAATGRLVNLVAAIEEAANGMKEETKK